MKRKISNGLKKIKRISFYFSSPDAAALNLKNKILTWLKRSPQVRIDDKNYQALIVIGGDGTILKAAKLCQKKGAVVVGLNLGRLGFLASVREPKRIFHYLSKLFAGQYQVSRRVMLKAEVKRRQRVIYKTLALNETVVINPLGMVEITTEIDGHPVQYIRGTGALLSTATGSTAYNLSAHGPIVMPDTNNIILTELLDHNLPTPSLVLNGNQKVKLIISRFRRKELLKIANTSQSADVLLVADGENIFPLQEQDEIFISRASQYVEFAEFEKHYFLKSLRDKFAFR
ncbi:MAG: NAD(+)/NADH kinase [Candidatus Doudnabacteria bacterium]|nr:NAD(+)/NADH kinase [Candidatus Doudnabacteria bacterium]